MLASRWSRSGSPRGRFGPELGQENRGGLDFAQKLLAQICAVPADVIRDLCATDLSSGPYLFTYARPASTLSPVPPRYLMFDLSAVHTRAFGEFIAAYKAQVKRLDYSDRQRIDTLHLRVLNIVLTAADWITPTKSAMADILHMVKGEGGSGCRRSDHNVLMLGPPRDSVLG
jgi:hypothetical protein